MQANAVFGPSIFVTSAVCNRINYVANRNMIMTLRRKNRKPHFRTDRGLDRKGEANLKDTKLANLKHIYLQIFVGAIAAAVLLLGNFPSVSTPRRWLEL